MQTLDTTIRSIALRQIDQRRPENAALRREILTLRLVEYECEAAGHPEIAAQVRSVIDSLVAEARA